MYKTAGRCPTCGRAEKKPPRSLEQNAYMWGVVYKTLSTETGHSIEDIHELMKHRFLGRVMKLQDEEFIIPTSTTDLDVEQMTDYLEQIRSWALDKLKILIPLPPPKKEP